MQTTYTFNYESNVYIPEAKAHFVDKNIQSIYGESKIIEHQAEEYSFKVRRFLMIIANIQGRNSPHH